MRKFFVFKDIPMPPSINRVYKKSFKTKRMYKSNEYMDFQRDYKTWELLHLKELAEASYFLQEAIENGINLRIDRFFKFLEVYNKDKTVKCVDVSNRIKVIDDELSKSLEIDDKYFFIGTEIKSKSGGDPHCDVKITILSDL